MDALQQFNLRRPIIIDQLILHMLDGDLQAAYLLTFILNRVLSTGGSPVHIRMGLTPHDAGTLCGELHLSYHRVRNVLHSIASRASKDTVSGNLLDYWRDEMNAIWFRVNFKVLNERMGAVNQDYISSVLNDEKLRSNLKFSNSENGVEFKIFKFGNQELNTKRYKQTPKMAPENVPPLYNPLEINNKFSHSSRNIIDIKRSSKEKNSGLGILPSGENAKDDIIEASPLKLQEHDAWPQIKEALSNWIEQLAELNKSAPKSRKVPITAALLKSHGNLILEWLADFSVEEILATIAYSTGKGIPTLYRPRVSSRSKSGLGKGTGNGDVLECFKKVSEDSPFPFVQEREPDLIENIAIQIEKAGGITGNEEDHAGFRAWYWGVLEFIDLLYENTYGEQEDGSFAIDPKACPGQFRDELGPYWKGCSRKFNKTHARDASFSYINKFIRENCLDYEHVNLGMFHKDAKLTVELFDDLATMSSARIDYENMDIPGFFESRFKALKSGAVQKEYDRLIGDDADGN